MPYCAYCGSQVAVATDLPCVNCQNPKSGRPRPMAPPPGSSNSKLLIIVGVVIAIPILVAIAGVVAAIAIPNFLTAMQRSKQKRTMADIRTVSTAVEAYAFDHNREFPRG